MAVATSGVMAAAGADELPLGPGGVLFGAEWPLPHAPTVAPAHTSAANLTNAAVRVMRYGYRTADADVQSRHVLSLVPLGGLQVRFRGDTPVASAAVLRLKRQLSVAMVAVLGVAVTAVVTSSVAVADPQLPPARDRLVAGYGGVPISVAEYGPEPSAAPTVVLVHGYPDDMTVWNKVIPLLADKYHVVNYDPRGSGASGHPTAVADYELPKLSADFEAVIDATAPGQAVHVLAHDWGAIQTWESAARIPQRIASFTFISGPSLDLSGLAIKRAMANPSAYLQLLDQLIRSSYIQLLDLPLIPELLWDTGLAEAVFSTLVWLEGGNRPPGYPPADGAAQANLYRANVNARTNNPTYDHVTVPVVQQIVATNDPFVGPLLTDQLEQQVPVLWRRTVDTGHWAQTEDPVDIAQFTTQLIEHQEHGGPTPPGVVVPKN